MQHSFYCKSLLMANPFNNKIFGVSRVFRTTLFARPHILNYSQNPSDFITRTEQAWLISQQPQPVPCVYCKRSGHVECKWCGGTGFIFFILPPHNMLCKNTTCVICSGKGSTRCPHCKGTGFRAKWLL